MRSTGQPPSRGSERQDYAGVSRRIICTLLSAAIPEADYGWFVIGQRWGVTDAEVARHYPCDDVLTPPVLSLWRGITVQAPVQDVWPWLCQLRLAPYSYDWLDNLGRRSPRELRGVPDPEQGEPFSCLGGKFDVGRIVSVAHEEHVTARIMGAVMSYVLIAQGDATRLVLKIVMRRGHWYASAAALGDWPMARRQLMNLKALAEG